MLGMLVFERLGFQMRKAIFVVASSVPSFGTLQYWSDSSNTLAGSAAMIILRIQREMEYLMHYRTGKLLPCQKLLLRLVNWRDEDVITSPFDSSAFRELVALCG